MKFAATLAAACALVAFAPVPAAQPRPAPATRSTEPAPDAIRQLVGRCRPLAIAAFRTGDTRALDAYVAELNRDRERRQGEIIACGAYLVGAGDAGFYGADPR